MEIAREKHNSARAYRTRGREQEDVYEEAIKRLRGTIRMSWLLITIVRSVKGGEGVVTDGSNDAPALTLDILVSSLFSRICIIWNVQ